MPVIEHKARNAEYLSGKLSFGCLSGGVIAQGTTRNMMAQYSKRLLLNVAAGTDVPPEQIETVLLTLVRESYRKAWILGRHQIDATQSMSRVLLENELTEDPVW